MELMGTPDDVVFDRLQHELAVFSRRLEQTRLGPVDTARSLVDRAGYLLLGRLDEEGELGVKALAAAMSIDSSTVTRQVAPLVDAGLVERTPHPADGRAVVLRLSATGRDRLAQVRAARRRLMAAICVDWPLEDCGRFVELLARFNVDMAAFQVRT